MFWIGAVVSLCYVPGVTGAYIATQWPVLAVLLSFGLLRSGPFTAFHAAYANDLGICVPRAYCVTVGTRIG